MPLFPRTGEQIWDSFPEVSDEAKEERCLYAIGVLSVRLYQAVIHRLEDPEHIQGSYEYDLFIRLLRFTNVFQLYDEVNGESVWAHISALRCYYERLFGCTIGVLYIIDPILERRATRLSREGPELRDNRTPNFFHLDRTSGIYVRVLLENLGFVDADALVNVLFTWDETILNIHRDVTAFLRTTRLTSRNWLPPPQRDVLYHILGRFIEAHYRLLVTLRGGNSVSLFLAVTFKREEFYNSSPSGSTRSHRSTG